METGPDKTVGVYHEVEFSQQNIHHGKYAIYANIFKAGHIKNIVNHVLVGNGGLCNTPYAPCIGVLMRA